VRLCRMPNAQRIIDRGMFFNRAYTPSAICCPARAMLISGAYHWHNGVYNQVHVASAVSSDMKPDVMTYSQRLREAGYYMGYCGKWHASHVRTPVDFGFEDLAVPMGCTKKMLEGIEMAPEDRLETKPDPFKMKILSERIFEWPETKPFAQWFCLEGDESETQPYWVASAALRMLERARQSEKPWCVEVHWQYPHDPYYPLKQYLGRYDPDDIPVCPSYYDTYEGKPNIYRRNAANWAPLSERDFREGRAHSFAFREQLDAQIGRVLDALESSEQADNTLIVLSTDHGDMVGAHRLYGKGWCPNEECYRIPLVASWPGVIEPGSACDRLVQLHDVGHTYMDALGLDPLPYQDGRSLLPLFEDPAREDWDDSVLCAYHGGHYVLSQRMLITSRYKYVHNGFDFDEMYDLEKDPYELTNMISDVDHAEIRQALRHQLLDKMKAVDDPLSKGGKHGINKFLFAE